MSFSLSAFGSEFRQAHPEHRDLSAQHYLVGCEAFQDLVTQSLERYPRLQAVTQASNETQQLDDAAKKEAVDELRDAILEAEHTAERTGGLLIYLMDERSFAHVNTDDPGQVHAMVSKLVACPKASLAVLRPEDPEVTALSDLSPATPLYAVGKSLEDRGVEILVGQRAWEGFAGSL